MDRAILDDLARSGLTERDAKRMRLEPLSALTANQKLKKLIDEQGYQGYVLRYFEINGKPNGFYRVRFTGPAAPLDHKGKQVRYLQEPGSPPHTYFSPLVDWIKVRDDPTVPVIVTEGEKKGYAGCKALGPGHAVLGLGGVSSYGSRALREPLLPELEPFLKARQKVVICFDRDPVPNPDVLRAYNKLARRARLLGSTVYRLELPELKPGTKAGLDDALVALGPDQVQALLEAGLTPYDDLTALTEMNAELAYIKEAGAVYVLPTGALYSQTQRLVNIIYADRHVVKYDKAGNEVEKNLAAEWLKWPGRRTHRALAYEPGRPEVLDCGALNIWPGLAVAPKKGDISMFLKLLDQVFADDADGAARTWVLQWLAYPLVHPGTKLYTGVLMYSELQGAGKSLIGETMGRIYGKNFQLIQAKQLHSSFNEWARNVQFVLGDEVTGSDRQLDEDTLKNIITQERVTINEKYQATFSLPARTNFWLTTNRGNAISLSPQDRRWFVWEILRQIFEESWYTREYDPWYKEPKNAAALLWYLLHKVDLTGFDPRGRAPVTHAKRDMQDVSGTGVDYLVRDLLTAPERYFLGDARELRSAGEVAAAIDPHGKLNPVTVALALKRAGVPRLDNTKTHRGDVKLYPLRRADYWTRAPHHARAAHYHTGAEVVDQLPRAKFTKQDEGRYLYVAINQRHYRGAGGRWVAQD